MSNTIPALTLTQPWASLVAVGAKQIETRSWGTKYRGPLAIHAAKTFPKEAREFADEPICFPAYLPNGDCFSADDLPLGAVVAIVRLDECVLIPPNGKQTVAFIKEFRMVGSCQMEYGAVYPPIIIPPPMPELAFGDYTPGRYAWIFGHIQPVSTPIPAVGKLGLWQWEPPPDLFRART